MFGRRLTITYFREMTPEEAELEARYAADDKPDATIEELRRKLDEVPYRMGSGEAAARPSRLLSSTQSA